MGTILAMAGNGRTWEPALDVLAREYAYRTLFASSPQEALKTIETAHVDLVVGEGEAGLTFLADLRTLHPQVVRVYANDGRPMPSPKALARAAIYQFVHAPIDPVQLGMVVARALEAYELARRHRYLAREFKVDEGLARDPEHSLHLNSRPESQRFEKLVYASEKMAHVCDLAKQAAVTELPILIQGETGTGKELLARAIHHNSSRCRSPLMVQNCGGIADEMLHSELFGHVRGAFTGAISDRLGLFRAADGGTVFLDEISEISPAFQVSLLRFLQEGEVKPIGSDKVSYCNVRIIAASNRSLKDMVAAKQFRQDLYFRLKGFDLELPPLRTRPDDIAPLARFLVDKHADAMGKKILGITTETLARLSLGTFPGNVRELENELRRMVALASDGDYLTGKHLSAEFQAMVPAQLSADANSDDRDMVGGTLKDQVEHLEMRLVSNALRRNRWNQSRAARELGLSRVGLASKVKRYRLEEVE